MWQRKGSEVCMCAHAYRYAHMQMCGHMPWKCSFSLAEASLFQVQLNKQTLPFSSLHCLPLFPPGGVLAHPHSNPQSPLSLQGPVWEGGNTHKRLCGFAFAVTSAVLLFLQLPEALRDPTSEDESKTSPCIPCHSGEHRQSLHIHVSFPWRGVVTDLSYTHISAPDSRRSLYL